VVKKYRDIYMTNFGKKIALVTGANRGIGFEIVRQLAQHDVHVLLSGRNPQAVARAVDRLKAEGLSVDGVVLDITNEQQVAECVSYVEHKYGRLDILVNNAGIRIEQYGRQPTEQPLHLWRETFETNLFGAVSVTVGFMPLILKSEAGRIVNVSSLLASLATHTNPDSYAYSPMFKSLPAYSASKSAINSWTIHLAFELKDTLVKVNAVHPGYTKTDMNEGEGDLDIPTGARTSVQMALLNKDGPSGKYIHMGDQVPW
jgi:NAD(P)-dependent dehydrogenase (short-subunit alcohol dehydrogenase family)